LNPLLPLDATQTLLSFVRNLHLIHVKRKAPYVKEFLPSHVKDYCEGRSTIKELAIKANYPPYLFARYIVEAVVANSSKKVLAKIMKDPIGELTLEMIDPLYYEAEKRFIEQSADTSTTRLALQVQQAVNCDPMYGPYHDKERHIVGIEYEVVLEHYLQQTGTYIFQNTDWINANGLTIGIALSTKQAFLLKQKPSFEIEGRQGRPMYYLVLHLECKCQIKTGMVLNGRLFVGSTPRYVSFTSLLAFIEVDAALVESAQLSLTRYSCFSIESGSLWRR
jgi:hypothetical protein